MVRGIPWIDLHLNHDENNNQNIDNSKKDPDTNVSIEVERNWEKDLMSIGRRTAFGVVCGSMTGAAFGTVDVLRDTKMMVSQKSVATAKVLRYTATFGVFFGVYHSLRRVLWLADPSLRPIDTNVPLAGIVALAPVAVFPKYRPLFPYGFMLVILDGINSVNE